MEAASEWGRLSSSCSMCSEETAVASADLTLRCLSACRRLLPLAATTGDGGWGGKAASSETSSGAWAGASSGVDVSRGPGDEGLAITVGFFTDEGDVVGSASVVAAAAGGDTASGKAVV